MMALDVDHPDIYSSYTWNNGSQRLELSFKTWFDFSVILLYEVIQ